MAMNLKTIKYKAYSHEREKVQAMRSLVLHGKGSSPEKVSWLWEPLKEFGNVEVPPFDYSVEEGLQLALRESFDLVAGHSRGGTIALLAGAKKGRPVIAVSAPTDRILQLEHLYNRRDLPGSKELYQYLSSIPVEVLRETSPVNHSSLLKDVLLIHGIRDEVVPAEHSKILCEKVREMGNRCTLLLLDMRHSPPAHLYSKIRQIIQDWIRELSA
jgi:Dipeptidyl aminopeptidases/acylaminoacyl-peptidases